MSGLLCLAAVSSPGAADAQCSGRGSLRGLADHETRCLVGRRAFQLAPGALLSGHPGFVTMTTVQRMRRDTQRLARRKRCVT